LHVLIPNQSNQSWIHTHTKRLEYITLLGILTWLQRNNTDFQVVLNTTNSHRARDLVLGDARQIKTTCSEINSKYKTCLIFLD